MIAIDLSLAAAAAIVSLGGVMRGFLGFGAGMILIIGLTIVYSPVDAVILTALLEIPAAVQLSPSLLRQAQWRTVIPMTASALTTIPLGAWLLVTVDPLLMKRTIALCVLGFATMLASGWRYRGPTSTGAVLVVGSTSGFLTGLVGIGGPPVIAYFLSGAHQPRHIRANITSFLMLSTFIALAAYAWHGAISVELVLRVLVLTPTYVLTIWAGGRLFHLATESTFRRVALVILVVMSVSALFS